MSGMEEKLRGVTKRGSRHGPRAAGPAASDWPAASGSGGGGRGQATPSSSQPAGSAYNRESRRQSSRDGVEPTGQQAPPEHGELLFKVLPSLLIHTSRTKENRWCRDHLFAPTLAAFATGYPPARELFAYARRPGFASAEIHRHGKQKWTIDFACRPTLRCRGQGNLFALVLFLFFFFFFVR